MQADLAAAEALPAALERRPDIQARLKHLLSPGNVRPYVMRIDGRGPLAPVESSAQDQLRQAMEGADAGLRSYCMSGTDSDDGGSCTGGGTVYSMRFTAQMPCTTAAKLSTPCSCSLQV
jgi:hypothetical protein